MDIKSKLKVDANFSMSSMTDIVFLLLIFFMLTASFITPSGLPVNLPSAAASNIVMQKNSVTITEDLRYYVISGPDGSVTLHVDKSVASEYLIKIAGIASTLKQKVTVVTKPE